MINFTFSYTEKMSEKLFGTISDNQKVVLKK
jgi:hypothetical protein